MNTDRTTNLLGALSLALADAQEQAARGASGLSPSACSAVVTLGLYPGTTIGEIARIAGLTHSVAVRLVDGLVSAGLLAREAGTDRRQVALRLTEEGERVRKRILAARAAALGQALDVLAPHERVALDAMLGRLLARLTTGRRSADHICRLCDETACGPDCPVEREAERLGEGLP